MVDRKKMQWELAKIRELFIRRMTVDSDHHDRRRNDYNQAIFTVREDGSTFANRTDTDMDMVLRCWDNAVRDYLTGRAPSAKVDAPMREVVSDA